MLTQVGRRFVTAGFPELSSEGRAQKRAFLDDVRELILLGGSDSVWLHHVGRVGHREKMLSWRFGDGLANKGVDIHLVVGHNL